MIPTKDGIFTWVTDTDYHADITRLSSTGARRLLPPSCPAKFKWLRDHPPIPSRQFDIGHVAHLIVLGKGTEIVEIDAPDYRTKDAREARDDAHTEGKTPVLIHELGECRQMAAAVLTHPKAGPIFAHKGGTPETSLYATDPETDVQLRARIDWLDFSRPDHRLHLVELKTSTTAHPEQFARKAAGYLYHFQAAFYLNIVRLLKLADDPVFTFVVVEKEPPYLVSMVEFDDLAIDHGTQLVRDAIDLYAQCADRDEWPGYPDDTTTISIPDWLLNDEMAI